jgi:hypothetical protein
MSVVSTESSRRYEDERKLAGAAKLAEERKAAANAKAILGWLTSSNARTDRLVFVLRNAANLAKAATLTRLESKRTLDALREDAASSLNAVCGLLDKGRLTEGAIDGASRAVIAWLDALPSEPA